MNHKILSPTLRSIITRIEAENSQEPLWIVGPETGKLLYWFVRVTKPKTILEIGTSVGYSALWMASALEDNGEGKLYTVESHQERYDRSQVNFEESGLRPRIVSLKGHAPEVFLDRERYGYDEYPPQWDLVFMDATKKEHPDFFAAVRPKLKEGSHLLIDNVLSHRFGTLAKFLDELHQDPSLKIVEIGAGQGLLLARVLS